MQRAKLEMMEAIRRDAERTAGEVGKTSLDERAMAAVGRVPRHEFVDASDRAHAYRNRPLPIGHGQTISQPFIVALMTDLAEVRPGDRVLEIGTGSGYQAAVLAELGAEVFSVEILASLARVAEERFERLGLDVRVRHGDGGEGWPDEAPFDSIVVTAAGPGVPPPLLDQLKPGGRLVLPLRGAVSEELVVITKDRRGAPRRRAVLPVRFVPLTGAFGR
ncbi:MAG: protein-L-isoaspartate(D-aspartate) O-methyltransferase [Acidobacteriota bacterium]